MGYKYNDIAIKCPLFRRVVKTRKGKFIGIECEPIPNMGFDVGQMIRLHTSADLKDYTDIFCKDRYTECPYYKIHSK